MKIAISGSSGFIGKKLIEKFKELKYTIIPLNRLDFDLGEDWLIQKIADADVVINLAGAPIAKRWTKAYKEIVYNSRMLTTISLVTAINNQVKKPELFISTSAIGIYNTINEHNEESKAYADNFLSHICTDWEAEANKAVCKTIIFRLSVVLDKRYGAFPKMFFPFKLGLGGKIGNGKQWFSWIYIDDLVNAFLHVIQNKNSRGVYNLASPQVITNADFTKLLAAKIKKPAIFNVPAFVFKLLYGDATIVITEGQNAQPKKLSDEGFKFKYPDFESVLDKLI